jgi:hypothetical protein
MKHVFIASVAFLGLAAVPAAAMPVAPLTDVPSAITLTAGGCGIGFHRGPWGGCRPNGGYYAYGYRPYAYGYHPYAYGYGFYGRRCWWRGGVRVCA